MKKMKLWSLFLIVVSVAVLPFALVAVGQPQQMTCWCIKPSQTERKRKHDDYLKAVSSNVAGNEAHANSAYHYAENDERGTASQQAG